MIRIEHNEGFWKFPFVEYIPEGENGSLPLVLQLHGAGERGNGGDMLKLVDVHGFSKLLREKDYPCRFILPQCPENDYWAARVESVLAFLEQLKAHFSVDEKRIYLTGMSMGGFGTWFTATAAPEKFAAIAPVCGGGMAWAAGALTMPVWAFHGSIDSVVDPVYSDLMVTALRKRGADVTYTLLEGVDHNAWDYAYNDALLSWLLSKKKQ